MGKIAFVFSGQGDQFSGMGRELFESLVAAKEAFELCESLREGTIKQCFEGTAEELKETKNTQPCLFAMELAACEALKAKSAGFQEIIWSGSKRRDSFLCLEPPMEVG